MSVSLALSFSSLPLPMFPDRRPHPCWIFMPYISPMRLFQMFYLSMHHVSSRSTSLSVSSVVLFSPLLFCFVPAAMSFALSVFPCGCHRIVPQSRPNATDKYLSGKHYEKQATCLRNAKSMKRVTSVVSCSTCMFSFLCVCVHERVFFGC